jgi:hypothetical protein
MPSKSWFLLCCHAALKSRKTDSDGQKVRLNRGNQDVFVVKTRTEWIEAESAWNRCRWVVYVMAYAPDGLDRNL